MTDQPERADSAGSAPVPDAAQPPAPAPASSVPAAAPWGAPPVGQPAPQAAWGAPAAPPAPATPPAPGAWGAPAAPPPGMPPAGPGASPGWAAGPASAPRPSRPRGTSGRAALGVLVIIIGVLFGANIVDAALPLPEAPTEVDPGPGLPLDQGGPVPTTEPVPTQDPGQPVEPGQTALPIQTLAPIETAPPVDPGPVAAGTGVDVGAGFVLYPADGWSAVGSDGGLTVFQKSGVLLIIGGVAWDGSAADLATGYRDAWFAGGQFSGDDPQSGAIGNGIPAAGVNYTGVFNGTQVDGSIIVGAVNGSGLLMNFFGASGSLRGVSSDLDLMLKTVQYTGG